MTIVLAIVCGILVGWTLATLGGGGSLFVMPALALSGDISVQEATRIAQVIVGVTSLFALWHYYRQRHVNWSVAVVMAVFGFVGVYFGDLLHGHVSELVAMVSLAALLLLTSLLMWQKATRSLLVNDDDDTPTSQDRPAFIRQSLPIILSGLTAGFLMGFLAVGGGFIMVPALALAVRMKMKHAIGTSLAVITINSLSGIITTITTEGIHTTRWELAIPFLAGSMFAGLIASRRATKMSPSTQQRLFACLTVIVAVAILVKWLVASG